MKIVLLAIGKTTEKYLSEGMKEYIKRINRYQQFEFVTLPDHKYNKRESIPTIKIKEGNAILDKLKGGNRLILLDEHGKKYTSVEFSQFLVKELSQTAHRLIFVIGGPYGFSDQVIKQATSILSLSDMTFSHQMVRLIFLEQLYRAFTILKGEPYHHE